MKRQATIPVRETPLRSGFTYIELMFTTLSASVLMLGLSSALYISTKAFDAGDTSAHHQIRSVDVLGNVLSDMRHAISFTDRTEHSATFTVPDRDGDARPESITYVWSGKEGSSLYYAYNGSPLAPIADDVYSFSLSFDDVLMKARRPPPAGGPQVLFVVNNESRLTTREVGRQAALEEWGYAVLLLSSADSASEFADAASSSDVIYVSGDSDAAAVADKLTKQNRGVVCENGDLAYTLGMAVYAFQRNADSVNILSDNHYITYDFAVNSTVQLTKVSQPLWLYYSYYASDNVDLASGQWSLPCISTIDAGLDLFNGERASGRRVMLPWGSAQTADLTAEGLELLKRSLEWGAGAGPNPPSSRLLMVVRNDTVLTSQELQRQALFEEWGYQVDLISASAQWDDFTELLADNDVAFIPASITDVELGTKLRDTEIGVVNASNDLQQEMGLMTGGSLQKGDRDEIDVIDKNHYITQFFPMGKVKVFDRKLPMIRFRSNVGVASVLARVENDSRGALATLDRGQQIEPYGGRSNEVANGRRVFLPFGADLTFEIDDLTDDGHLLLKRSLEWAAGAESVVPTLLLVVDGSCSPAQDCGVSNDEQKRKSQLERFGYRVLTIGAQASQNTFNEAIDDVELIYVCETVTSTQLGNKLDNAAIGVVSEERYLNDEIGFSTEHAADRETELSITHKLHYITQPIPKGVLQIYSADVDLTYLAGEVAPGIQTLATNVNSGARQTLVAIAPGDILSDGTPAVGRRVKLPWGNDVDFDDINDNGLMIMERALLWARGAGDNGTPDAASAFVGVNEDLAVAQDNLAQTQIAMQVVLPEDGMFQSITARLGDGSKDIRLAVYSDTGGEPNSLIQQTARTDPDGSGPQWTTVDLPPTNLPAGTYWLAFALEDSGQQYFHDSDPSTQVRFKSNDAVKDGFSVTWGESETVDVGRISIHATYLPLK